MKNKIYFPNFSNHQQTNTDLSQSGQIGLITLLIMGVVLTVAISLSQRTVQEQQVATTQDESTRAFNAAEIGIERGLANIKLFEEGGALDSEDSFNVENEQVSYKINDNDIFDMTIGQNRTAQIPLKNDAGQVTINWHKGGGCADDPRPAAIIVSVYRESAGNYSSLHYGYDPCNPGTTNFASPGTAAGEYEYEATIHVVNDDRFIRVRPLYSSSEFQISGGLFLNDAAQYEIQSYAAAAESARSIHVKKSRMIAPSYMDFALLSGSGSIAK